MLILRLSKREDQALIPISTILKFSALKYYGIRLKLKYWEHSQFLYQIVVSFSGKSCLTGLIKLVPFFSSFICFSDVQRCLFFCPFISSVVRFGVLMSVFLSSYNVRKEESLSVSLASVNNLSKFSVLWLAMVCWFKCPWRCECVCVWVCLIINDAPI